MRKPAAVSVAPAKAPFPAGRGDDTPLKLVCLALAFSLLALGFRIASIW
jgi:hypothetical protein